MLTFPPSDHSSPRSKVRCQSNKRLVATGSIVSTVIRPWWLVRLWPDHFSADLSNLCYSCFVLLIHCYCHDWMWLFIKRAQNSNRWHQTICLNWSSKMRVFSDCQKFRFIKRCSMLYTQIAWPSSPSFMLTFPPSRHSSPRSGANRTRDLLLREVLYQLWSDTSGSLPQPIIIRTRKTWSTKFLKWVRVKEALRLFCLNWIPGGSRWLGAGVTKFPRHITCLFHCTSKHST